MPTAGMTAVTGEGVEIGVEQVRLSVVSPPDRCRGRGVRHRYPKQGDG